MVPNDLIFYPSNSCSVIKVHLDINISAVAFRSEMEHNLARAYVEAYQRGEHILNGTYQPLRKKRFALVKDVALQVLRYLKYNNHSCSHSLFLSTFY